MAYLFRFFFGAAIGSFLNVLAVRYDPDRFLFAEKVIGGRSRCPKCEKTLRWFELIPLVSYVLQGGKCRRCNKKISPQYFLVEALCGLIFLFVPLIISTSFQPHFNFISSPFPSISFQSISISFPSLSTSPLSHFNYISVIWTLSLLILLLISLIDLKWQLIPDELSIALAALGLTLGFMDMGTLAPRVLSALGAGGFFWLIFELYRRARHMDGMGFGDVKLAAALGLLLGFPMVLVALMTAFFLGGLLGIFLIAFGKSGMKTAVPFGPFLAAGSFIAFAFGDVIVSQYLSLLLYN